ncbi:MAG: asparaginase [Streptosporangiales bacterium]|nr:asparaginase [Streptosporangiales bacterium]
MTAADRAGLPVLAEVDRGGFVESWHTGSVVAVDAMGEVTLTVGRPDVPCYPRSSNKPLQATAMVRCGLELPADLLALACASHSGEPMHVAGVRRLLASVGLDGSALQCPPDWPLDETARRERIAAGGEPDRLHMNCSGKHAAMLATCVVRDWPLDTYLDPEHPLQQRIRATIEELTGESVVHTGVDGCGAPLFAFSLRGLARGYRALGAAAAGTAQRRVVAAFLAYPELTSGTRRDEARLMRGIPGLLDKGGAEAVDALLLPDGSALAVKIADGSQRARTPVTVAALRTLGYDAAILDDLATALVLGAGRPVGEIRVAEGFARLRAGLRSNPAR